MDNLIVRCVLLDITKIKQDKRVVHHVKQGNIVIQKAQLVAKPVLLGNIKANQEKQVVRHASREHTVQAQGQHHKLNALLDITVLVVLI